MTNDEKVKLKEIAKECLANFAKGIEKIAYARDRMDYIVQRLNWDDMSKFDYETAMSILAKCLADLAQWESYIDEHFNENETDKEE